MPLPSQAKVSPLLAIGLPVYNGEAALHETIKSLREQTFQNFRIIISDNCSSDNTEQICRAYCDLDKRISYTRQKRNLGAEKNFLYVLRQSDCKYFIWVAVGDLHSKDSLMRNLKFLETNLDYVASTSQAHFVGSDRPQKDMGDRPIISDNPGERMAKFLRGFHSNAAFYSVYRTKEIQSLSIPEKTFLGWDWLVSLSVLKKGKVHRESTSFLWLAESGQSSEQLIFKKYRNENIEKIFPFFELTKFVINILGDIDLKSKTAILVRLFYLNMLANSQRIYTSAYVIFKTLQRGYSNFKNKSDKL
jgi:glycosyltransferase involved in cell wall biosynthesis